ncbi:hypothetical protein [Psychrobacillus sp. FJAT-21963]|uniref:hypothetical protein n=1 Tax=Psychrobacillus sp. FJAT-21963 TaxID=1712028 RepID=UPI00070851AD|nr:hypothetical protein [Psychrobacillus sp. FJAT-21963]KQL37117.1 hypothetical protein AN959_03495 [Psychrobacillus sp. FJAT-21963]
MQIGRRIYYDASTGNLILDTGEKEGSVVPTTIEQDYESYTALKDRVPSLLGVIELEFGEFAQDFMESNGVRVNLVTKGLEFSYPDPSEPEAPPIYQAPLSKSVSLLEQENAMLQMSVMELSSYAASQDERLQVQENAVMELSMLIAGGM